MTYEMVEVRCKLTNHLDLRLTDPECPLIRFHNFLELPTPKQTQLKVSVDQTSNDHYDK